MNLNNINRIWVGYINIKLRFNLKSLKSLSFLKLRRYKTKL